MKCERVHHRLAVSLFLVALAVLICVQSVAAYNVAHDGEPVHEYIGEQALAIYAASHPNSEIERYYPGVIKIGAGNEDLKDHVYDRSGGFTTITHFWNADNGDGDEVTIAGGSSANSWQKAEILFGMAVGKYRAGDKTAAYEYLGHVAHLLADQSVPAHAHEDAHWTDDDCYEDWMTLSNAQLTREEKEYLLAKGPVVFPNGTPSYGKLYYLFYTTNQVGDFFASDDVDGDRTDSCGGCMGGIYTELGMDSVTRPLTSGALSDNDGGDNNNDGDLGVIRRYSYFYAIRSTAALFKYFDEAVTEDGWVTVVIQKVNARHDHGNWLYDDDADFFVEVDINGVRYRNEGDQIVDNNNIVPHWAFARYVGDSGWVLMKIQLWDEDPAPNPDDKSDIDPTEDMVDLDFGMDLDTGAISGDVAGYPGLILASTGDRKPASYIEIFVLGPTLKVTSITPNTGFQGDDDAMVYIGGKRFRDGATVKLKRVGYDDIHGHVAVASSTEMRCYFNLTNAAEGPWDVYVANSDGGGDYVNNGFIVLTPLTITSFTPEEGILGTTVQTLIHGTGFRDGVTVTLESIASSPEIPGNIWAYGSDYIICDFVIPATATPYPRFIKVRNPGESNLAYAYGFTIYAPLSVAEISPNTGMRGTTVTTTINGTGFRQGATVKLSKITGSPGFLVKINATDIDIHWTGTVITCTFELPPTAVTGAWSVLVTNPDGTSESLRDAFSVEAMPPTVTAIAPTSGLAGTSVTATITGTYFRADSTVKLTRVVPIMRPLEPVFVNIRAPKSTTFVVSATQITCTFELPSTAAAGAWNVVVTGPDDKSASLHDGFEVVAPPSVASIAPNAGNAGATIPVSITGTNFQPGAVVKLTRKGSEIAAVSEIVISPTTINCSFALPSTAATGTWSVVVVNPDRRSGTLSVGFTVIVPLTVTSIMPNTGAQGTTVSANINGTGFLSGAMVKLTRDRVPLILAKGVSVVSPTQITCTFELPPTATVGAWNVVVTNPGGAIGARSDGFTVIAPATVTAIKRNQGVQGTTVLAIINGTDFPSGSTVKLTRERSPPIPATGVVVVSATQISCTFVLPSTAVTGAWNVVVTNPDGPSATLLSGFTIIALKPLTVASIKPHAGAPGTNVSASILGTGFFPGATVRLTRDGNPPIEATQSGVESPTGISCTFEVPSDATMGTWNVVVTNPGGASVTLANEFTIARQAPAVTSITPNTGSRGSTVAITNLSGSGFVTGAMVTLIRTGSAEIAATGIAVISPEKINGQFVLPSTAALGTWNVIVTNPDGQSGTPPDGFTVTEGTLQAVVMIPGCSGIPTDPDGDGLFEDLNGNLRPDFNDVVLMFNQMQWIAANEPVSAFDFNANGRIDFNDIVKLFGEI